MDAAIEIHDTSVNASVEIHDISVNVTWLTSMLM